MAFEGGRNYGSSTGPVAEKAGGVMVEGRVRGTGATSRRKSKEEREGFINLQQKRRLLAHQIEGERRLSLYRRKKIHSGSTPKGREGTFGKKTHGGFRDGLSLMPGGEYSEIRGWKVRLQVGGFTRKKMTEQGPEVHDSRGGKS